MYRYYPLIQDPVYRAVAIFSSAILVFAAHTLIYHASHYGTFSLIAGITALPLLYLISIPGFSDTLSLDENGNGTFTKRFLFFVCKSFTFVKLEAVVDQKYAALECVSHQSRITTSIVLAVSDAQRMVAKITSMLASREHSHE